jgi:hypothetical protein
MIAPAVFAIVLSSCSTTGKIAEEDYFFFRAAFGFGSGVSAWGSKPI